MGNVCRRRPALRVGFRCGELVGHLLRGAGVGEGVRTADVQ